MIKEYTSKKDFEKIKDTTLNIEKNILNNYHSHNDFKRLIDTIVLYSDYSFFNTLLIDYQYPFFLDLGTENKYKKNGFTILNNAKKINILSPDNDVFVKVKNDDKEEKEDEEVDTHEEFVAEGEDDIVEDSFDDDEAPESVDDIIEGLFGKSGEEEE